MKRLDDETRSVHYDSQGMIEVIDRFGSQCAEAIERGNGFTLLEMGRIDRVIVCGMGGSAMAGDIARRFSRVPLSVNRSYTLPAFVDRQTLLVAISYSGNTAETLSSLQRGLKQAHLF